MKVALVCSHGGHLTELQRLAAAWDGHDAFWITYDSPRTRQLRRAYLVQNIGLNPILMLFAMLRIMRVYFIERPAVVISTGAEIAIPALWLARLFRRRTIFIEVWTRVRRPTGTGRLVYPVADAFFVQWPELLEVYGDRARYEGSIA
jgi:beta-1,4-N-acetylglucosaminyltransferase